MNKPVEEFQKEIEMYTEALQRYQALESGNRAEAMALKKLLVGLYDRMNELYCHLRITNGRKTEDVAIKDKWGNRLKMIKELYVDCRTISNQQVSDWHMDR